MANPYSMFKTDEKLEQEGIILDYGKFRIRIAHAGGSNKKYSNLISARLKQYERQIAIGALDDEVGARVVREVYADSIILDFQVKKIIPLPDDAPEGTEEEFVWEQGILAEDGSVIPFNRANVIMILKHIPRLFFDIRAQAENFGLFRASEVAENQGN